MSSLTFPLGLRRLPRRLHEPAGWLIPGADPAVWLAELARWRLPEAALTLWAVPRSAGDLRPQALLAVPAEGRRPVEVLRALPLGLRAGRLYLPADARLDPPVPDAELLAVLAPPVALLHPCVGLVGFDAADRLDLADLLEPPPARPSRWDRADPGLAPPPPLRAVEPVEPPVVELLIDEGRSDIGSDPLRPPPVQLPSPRQPARWLASRMLRGLRRLTELAPSTADRPTWIDRLRAWTDDRLTQLSESIERARRRAVERLLDQLVAEPDEGLRHAIPLEGPAGRGIAPPGTVLQTRLVDFDLDRMFGSGGTVDAWNLPASLQLRLDAAYRDAAERELRLGRHRRAAYILGHLLGDHEGAAGALEAGGCYREAAVLYRDKLARPLAAARCLERGGLLTEALAIYTAEGQHELAGDLLLRLERPEEAAGAYRLAVTGCEETGDLVHAAELLETRLAAPDEALVALARGWPEHPSAATCLQARYALLGRLGRHDAAARLGLELEVDCPARAAPDLVRVLAEQAASYPDAGVRTVADDTARVAAGRRLRLAGPAARGLLDALAGLGAGDPLLARDLIRYGEATRVKHPRRAAGVAPPARQPVVVWRAEWPESLRVEDVDITREELLVAGVSPGGLACLIRARWHGPVEIERGRPIADHVRLSVRAGQGRQPPILLPALAAIGGADWLPEDALAGAYGRTGRRLALRTGREVPLLAVYREQGGLAQLHRLLAPRAGMLDPHGDGSPPRARIIVREELYVGCGRWLLRASPPAAPIRLDHPLRDLCASALHSRPRLAVTFERGGLVAWGGPDWLHTVPYATTVERPLSCFCRNGRLVTVSMEGDDGLVHDTSRRRVTLLSTFRPPCEPSAIVPGPEADQFALIDGTGVTLLRLPR